MGTPFIEFRDVVFTYNKREILHKVSFSVEEGYFCAVMGASGSGKTTLLRLLTRQIEPSSGQILVGGRDLSSFSHTELNAYRKRMGVLFQFGALFTDLNVFDNVAFPLREHTRLPEKWIHDLVILKLHAVGLRGIEKLMPSQLSGGMARRVALARSIALDPTLILYDEPFTGLDPISLGVIAHLISRVNHTLKSTSIMVTHDIEKSLQIAQQVVFLAEGQIQFSGSPNDMRQSQSAWVQQFLSGAPHGPVEYRFPASTSLQDDLVARQR